MGRKLQFFVAGLGRFGESVAVTLEKMGYDVMAMDIAEDVVQDLSDTLGYVGCQENRCKSVGPIAWQDAPEDRRRQSHIF